MSPVQLVGHLLDANSPARIVARRLRLDALEALTARAMKAVDGGAPPNAPNEIRLFTKMRNEAALLPGFFAHYTRLGVDRFFVVDHRSTDASLDIARAHPRTHTFSIGRHLREHVFWYAYLLQRYGAGSWCLVVDVDERLVYPSCEHLDLRGLTAHLDRGGYDALDAVLVDLFTPPGEAPPDIPPDDLTGYRFSPDLRRERVSSVHRNGACFMHDTWMGGLRERVFGVRAFLGKTPLFRSSRDKWVTGGAHAVTPCRSAPVSGALLHLKFAHEFGERVRRTLRDRQHYDAPHYADYEAWWNDPQRPLPADVVAYAGISQLVELGIVRTTAELSALGDSA
jgi:hypothetical protein